MVGKPTNKEKRKLTPCIIGLVAMSVYKLLGSNLTDTAMECGNCK